MLELLVQYKQARDVAKNYWVQWAQIIKKDTLAAYRAKAKAENQDLAAQMIYLELYEVIEESN